MSRTAAVSARVEAEVKEQAEQILGSLGISMSTAIDMFLRQVVMRRGIPFEAALPRPPVPDISLPPEELAAELDKGLKDIKEGRTVSVDGLKADFPGRYGVEL